MCINSINMNTSGYVEGVCSICMVEFVKEMHCSVCTTTNDKLVCKLCIKNMFKLCSCPLCEVYYECPHCRTKINEPKWVGRCLDAQKQIVNLLRSKYQTNIR